jgi:hypothetical protein
MGFTFLQQMDYLTMHNTYVFIVSIFAGIALTLFYKRFLYESFKKHPDAYYSDTYAEGNYIPDDPTLISQKSHQYSTIPYRMDVVKSIGKRGCESDAYSTCISRHDVQSELDVPDDIQQKCESESNSKCCFPDIITQSRTEPYHMYSQYV